MRESNKEQFYLKKKPLKTPIGKQLKFKPGELSSSFTIKERQSEKDKEKERDKQAGQKQRSLRLKLKQNESLENVSLIEGASFISNKHDGSLDSMDKIIIGVASMGIDENELQYQEQKDQQSKNSATDIDFIQIHKQYEKLIGRNKILGQQQQEQDISDEQDQSSHILEDEDEWHIKQLITMKKQSIQISNAEINRNKLEKQKQLKAQITKIYANIEQIRQLKDRKLKKYQDSSNNSIKILVTNLGNLSGIHEQKEYLNINTNFMNAGDQKRGNEQDEQQFIDFVSQPDPQVNLEIQNDNLGRGVLNRIQKQQKKDFFREDSVNLWQVSPMLQNLDLELQKEKDLKGPQTNYQQILQALNSKQQMSRQRNENDHEQQEISLVLLKIVERREKWIKQHSEKTQKWKQRQMNFLSKMKLIMKDPHFDFDSEESEQA